MPPRATLPTQTFTRDYLCEFEQALEQADANDDGTLTRAEVAAFVRSSSPLNTYADELVATLSGGQSVSTAQALEMIRRDMPLHIEQAAGSDGRLSGPEVRQNLKSIASEFRRMTGHAIDGTWRLTDPHWLAGLQDAFNAEFNREGGSSTLRTTRLERLPKHVRAAVDEESGSGEWADVLRVYSMQHDGIVTFAALMSTEEDLFMVLYDRDGHEIARGSMAEGGVAWERF